MSAECCFSSSLLHQAAAFTGEHGWHRAVLVEPAPSGVHVLASNRGALTYIGWDPRGIATEAMALIVDSKMALAARGIKTAEREFAVRHGVATVTTLRKNQNHESKAFPLRLCEDRCPSIQATLDAIIELFTPAPALSATTGCYDAALLAQAMALVTDQSDHVVLSALPEGPLRLQLDNALLLLMPQTQAPIPALPEWLTGAPLVAAA